MKKSLYNTAGIYLTTFITVFLFLFIGRLPDLFSQTKFTLKECIDYASKNHNIMQQQLLSKQKSLLDLDGAKKAILPEISATIKANNNWGLYVDPVSNLITRQRNIASSTNINLNMTLFSGWKNYYTIDLKNQSVTSADIDKERNLRQISSAVVVAYYNVLMGKEQLSNARKIKEEIEKEKKFIEGRVEKGFAHKRDLLSIDYQLSAISFTETEAVNFIETSLFDLKQSAGINQADQIDLDEQQKDIKIEKCRLSLQSADSIALACSPEIEKARLDLKMAESTTMIAKSARYPTLSLYSTIGTKTSTKKEDPFNEQFRGNQNQVLGLTLTVPVYSNNTISNSISSAELDTKLKQIDLSIISEAVQRELKVAYLAVNSSYEKYGSLHKQYNAADEEFKYSQKLFEIGNISSFEYSLVRNRLINAQSALIQAKYDYLYRTKILDLYLGKQIE